MPVVDGYGVVVPVEAVDEGLYGGLVQVAQIGSRLPRLLPQHHGLRVYQPAASLATHNTGLHGNQPAGMPLAIPTAL